ncbi:ABC transporter permease [Kitasatospora sp. NPDC096147]|uniref:ABC transporter permease n=1 Tax=Kitasatospora sp. NPDC096147 TaxID=3364093 RepID=UPI003808036F
MTATAATATTTAPASTALSRMLALGRAETTLLLRNRTALFTALVLPPLMTVALSEPIKEQGKNSPGVSAAALVVTGLLGLLPLFVVYYNLTAAYVARRGELVLKRMRTGEARDAEILGGSALPSLLLSLTLSVVLCAAAALLMDLPAPSDPVRVVLGVLLGLVVLVPLAALSSIITKTVESSGLTTLPLLLISQFGSGMIIPLDSMPDQFATFCRLLPTTPAVQLVREGWTGTTGWGEALPQLGLAVAWTLVAGWAALRWFRWEPRR